MDGWYEYTEINNLLATEMVHKENVLLSLNYGTMTNMKLGGNKELYSANKSMVVWSLWRLQNFS